LPGVAIRIRHPLLHHRKERVARAEKISTAISRSPSRTWIFPFVMQVAAVAVVAVVATAAATAAATGAATGFRCVVAAIDKRPNQGATTQEPRVVPIERKRQSKLHHYRGAKALVRTPMGKRLALHTTNLETTIDPQSCSMRFQRVIRTKESEWCLDPNQHITETPTPTSIPQSFLPYLLLRTIQPILAKPVAKLRQTSKPMTNHMSLSKQMKSRSPTSLSNTIKSQARMKTL